MLQPAHDPFQPDRNSVGKGIRKKRAEAEILPECECPPSTDSDPPGRMAQQFPHGHRVQAGAAWQLV